MAAASISMIVGVYAGVLGGVVLGDIAKAEEKAAARGEAAAERNALRSEEKALDEVYVIGRRDDTKAFIGRPGHNVLNLPDKGPGHWTERKNEIWVLIKEPASSWCHPQPLRIFEAPATSIF